jgi:4-amino-4-deoxy-L-arabinose transferase-like glycosyltransferase
MSPTSPQPSLSLTDYLCLAGLCIILFGYSIVEGRTLTTHEAVHCQNVREMLIDHDWIIPHYGGRAWMERPPLPHWLTALPAAITGHPEREWSMRLGPALMGLCIVLLTSWMAGRWFGRTVGILSGAILATMRELLVYATGPECDIFLCGTVTATFACFTALEFPPTPAADDRWRFLGARPLAMFGFFFFLGLNNMAKGLFFGIAHVVVPIAAYFVWNMDFRAVRRYAWLWGWLVFVAAGAAWPAMAYLRQPDVVDFWRNDYLGRVSQSYMQGDMGTDSQAKAGPAEPPIWLREPWWYYFANLPLNLVPWTIPAFAGLALLFKTAWREAKSPERFLVCWAVMPLLFFSLPQGKHHHYLLHCTAPWAILSAHAALRLWQYALAGPSWLKRPWPILLTMALPACVAVAVVRIWSPRNLPGPGWILPVVLVSIPAVVLGFWWAIRQTQARTAFLGFFGILIAVLCGLSAYRTQFLDRYAGDRAFLHEVARHTDGRMVYLNNDYQPLEASWFLYYSEQPTHLLQNLTFLLDDRIHDPEVYVIARRRDQGLLEEYGTTQPVLQSERSRVEATPADRWTLFQLRFHDNLKRVPGDVPISSMQAAGRAPGPYLGASSAVHAAAQ